MPATPGRAQAVGGRCTNTPSGTSVQLLPSIRIYHFCRECVTNKIVNVRYLPIAEMPAELFTKGLCSVKHYIFFLIGFQNVSTVKAPYSRFLHSRFHYSRIKKMRPNSYIRG